MLKIVICFVFFVVMISYLMLVEVFFVCKDEIFSMIEGCCSNYIENEINEDLLLMFEVVCEL